MPVGKVSETDIKKAVEAAFELYDTDKNGFL